MSGPHQAVVVLKPGTGAKALAEALKVEGQQEQGAVKVSIEVLRRQRVRLAIEAPRSSLLRATLKAYLQWAACSDQLGQQIDIARLTP